MDNLVVVEEDEEREIDGGEKSCSAIFVSLSSFK